MAQLKSSRRRLYILGAFVLVTAAAVGGPYTYWARAPIRRHSAVLDLADPGGAARRPLRPGRFTDHVIIVSVDGLRPDAIARYAPRTLQRLAREGAVSLTAQTIAPSVTLPSHTSMLTGTEPAVHGITWNTDLTLVRGQQLPVPTVFTLAKQAGFETAAFFSKSKFHHLEETASLDYSQSPGSGTRNILAYRTTEGVKQLLELGRPNLLFVHLADTDYAGHYFGWMSAPYGLAVRAVDRALAGIVQAADGAFGRGRYVIIVTSDHGGNGRGHSAPDARNRTIPWIAWGDGVARGTTLPRGIRTMDTAATALWLLGIPIPAHVVGRPITAAFTASSVRPAPLIPSPSSRRVSR